MLIKWMQSFVIRKYQLRSIKMKKNKILHMAKQSSNIQNTLIPDNKTLILTPSNRPKDRLMLKLVKKYANKPCLTQNTPPKTSMKQRYNFRNNN